MAKKRISFFTHDLAANPVVRTVPLAQALAEDFEIEILGFLFSGTEVYEPYRGLFEFKTLECRREVTSVCASLPRLASLATGDIVYACKPLLSTLGPALVASGCGRSRPLFLDAEDDEWVPMGRGWAGVLWKDVLKGWRHATATKYTVALHPWTRCARGVSVSSTKLQRRYGGTIVLHGPDGTVFDPSREEFRDGRALKKRWDLPDGRLLALFAGTPQPHKGFDTLVDALCREQAGRWDLVLAGPAEHYDFVQANERLGSRCHRVGLVRNDEMAALLSVVDVVPCPQKASVFAVSQIPAKVLESMAMARPVIASRVGDLPKLLGEGSRGWLFDAANAEGLAGCLASAGNATERQTRGNNAREWFLREASKRATRERLMQLIRPSL